MSSFYPQIGEIENIFYKRLKSYLSSEVQVDHQFPVETQCATYWLDFKIQYSQEMNLKQDNSRQEVRIGIECDGREYHDWEYDFWRDSLILGTGKVDEIIRITGHQIYLYVHSCIFNLGRWYPWILGGRSSATEKDVYAALERISKNEFLDENAIFNAMKEEYGDNYDFTNAKEHEYEDIFNGQFLKRRSVSYIYSIAKSGSMKRWFDSHIPYSVIKRISWRDCDEYSVRHGGRNLKGIIKDL